MKSPVSLKEALEKIKKLKMEDAEVKKDHLFGKSLKKWENVFRTGSDYRNGAKIFEKNHRIISQSVALLYSLGIEKVPVFRKISQA